MNGPDFGRLDLPAWKTAEEIAALYPKRTSANQIKALLLSAQLHHRYVLRIRARLIVQGLPMKAYAKLAGMSYDRMLKVMRGTALLRLEDLGTADLLLGEVSEFARAEVQQLRLAAAKKEQASRQADQEEARYIRGIQVVPKKLLP